jgi:uncharacterized membrane protein YfcA
VRYGNHFIFGVIVILLGALFVWSSFQDVEKPDPGENSPFRKVLFGSVGIVISLLGIHFIRQWHLERKGVRLKERKPP